MLRPNHTRLFAVGRAVCAKDRSENPFCLKKIVANSLTPCVSLGGAPKTSPSFAKPKLSPFIKGE